MGNSQKKDQQRGKLQRSTLFAGISEEWRQKLPVAFFVLGFVALMILFYIFWLSDFFGSNIQPHIISVNVKLSSLILNLFNMGVHTSGALIYSASFSINLARGCDAVEAMAMFLAALLAFPARWHFKLAGFFAGIAALFLLNIARVVSLFLIGLHHPGIFNIMHVEIWQGVFIIFAIGIWIFWIRWTQKAKAHAA